MQAGKSRLDAVPSIHRVIRVMIILQKNSAIKNKDGGSTD